MKKSWYLISYDVSDNKTRKKMEKLCSTYLQRTQYSVFEGMLTESKLDLFRNSASRICRENAWSDQTDSILICRICADCYSRRMIVGKHAQFTKNCFVI